MQVGQHDRVGQGAARGSGQGEQADPRPGRRGITTLSRRPDP